VRTRLAQSAIGGLVGLLAAGTAIGVGELLAAAVRPRSAPVIAVGGAAVDRTPRALKEFAIRQFGENDKHVLVGGIFATLAVFAIVVGIVARRRPVLGAIGVGLFGVIGAAAALTRPTARAADVLPSVVGAVAGIGALLLLLRPLRSPAVDTEPQRDAEAVRVPAVAGAGGATRAGSRPRPGSGPGSVPDPGLGPGPGPEDPRSGSGPAGPGNLRAELVRIDRKQGAAVDRRGFLVAGTAVAAVAALAGVAGRKLQSVRFDASTSRAAIRLPAPADPAPRLPSTVRVGVPGVSPYITPNRSFYRVDTALVVPQVPSDTWELRVHGMVDHELRIDYQTLLRRRLIERDITMTCVSNEVGGTLVGTARWLGAPLKALLDEAGVHPGADQIVGTSSDGMTIGTPTSAATDGRDAMLAIGMNGEPLPLEHGFPVRMIVPGLYGYVSGTKWLVDLELTTFDAVDPYWVQRGWMQRAPIKSSSRIDTPKPFARVQAGKVAVAGMAWAQHRGISAVEVRVDDGPWQRARLAADPSSDLWVQWVFEWTATASSHTLAVRATDRSGQTQVEQRTTPFPSGSTGWHSVVVTVS
jgi:DMSO/TMAO reductase YedYZ molybdopterin-dependent catalytic subunit